MMVPSRWIIEIAVSPSSASEPTKSSKWDGSTPRTGKADDLALAADDLARKHRGPDLGDLADDRLDDHVGRRLARRELLEVAPVSDVHVRHRPHLGRIDQPALGVEQIQGADMRQHRELRAQHLMRAQCRHLAFEVVGGVDPVRPQAGHDVVAGHAGDRSSCWSKWRDSSSALLLSSRSATSSARSRNCIAK